MYVVDRLIEAVCEIDYPRELLEIQVLDDSTDETTRDCRAGRAAACGAAASTSSTSIASIAPATRPARSKPACKVARGRVRRDLRRRLRAADGLPAADAAALRRDPKVGMVQARWGHLNRDYSLLTRIQSILLDGHFVLEHGGRNRAGCFFNFNGTAGIWRREAIGDAGGWQHDTLTEDLDLSYRAQLRGWRFVFLPDLVVAGRSAGRDERLQVAAAPLGEGLDPDLHASCCRASCGRRPAVRGQGRSVLPPHGQLQLPADVAALAADVPGDGGPLQHGLVRDAAHRRAALLRGHGVGRQLLHRLASASCTRTGSRG